MAFTKTNSSTERRSMRSQTSVIITEPSTLEDALHKANPWLVDYLFWMEHCDHPKELSGPSDQRSVFCVIPMPVTEDGHGPASPEDTHETLYQVWDDTYTTLFSSTKQSEAEQFRLDLHKLAYSIEEPTNGIRIRDRNAKLSWSRYDSHVSVWYNRKTQTLTSLISN